MPDPTPPVFDVHTDGGPMIVYITINDTKQGKPGWSDCFDDATDAVSDQAVAVHGSWVTTVGERRRAVWCVELHEPDSHYLRTSLAFVAEQYQASITWATVEPVGPYPPAPDADPEQMRPVVEAARDLYANGASSDAYERALWAAVEAYEVAVGDRA